MYVGVILDNKTIQNLVNGIPHVCGGDPLGNRFAG